MDLLKLVAIKKRHRWDEIQKQYFPLLNANSVKNKYFLEVSKGHLVPEMPKIVHQDCEDFEQFQKEYFAKKLQGLIERK